MFPSFRVSTSIRPVHPALLAPFEDRWWEYLGLGNLARELDQVASDVGL